MEDIGWVLIYLFAFGISDIIVQKYIKSTKLSIIYYILLCLVGIIIINFI